MTSADAEAFETIMAGIEIPSYIVTTAAGGDRAGCLSTLATRCSIEPPRFAVCLSKLNHPYRVAQSAQTLVVHLLRHGDDDLAEGRGSRSDADQLPFSDVGRIDPGYPISER